MKQWALCVIVLIGVVCLAGCGADRSVDIPEEPAPMPAVEPETASASSPAADPTAAKDSD